MTCCVGMGIFIALGAMGPKIKGSSTLIRTNNSPTGWILLISFLKNINFIKKFTWRFILKIVKNMYVLKIPKIVKDESFYLHPRMLQLFKKCFWILVY
jgi:hypothetical protein